MQSIAGNVNDFLLDSQFRPVAGSPFTLSVAPAAVDPSKTVLTGLVSTVTAGQIPLVKVEQRDRFGNLAFTSSIQSALEATASRPDGAGAQQSYQISSHLNGTITLPLGPLTLAGIWHYNVRWNGVSILPGTHQVVVNPGPLDAAASSASGFAVGAHFDDGETALDSAAKAVYANSNIQVLAFASLLLSPSSSLGLSAYRS
jgi:hypothetical protein